MIRKLASGEYRLYSRKKDAKTGKRRNLGTFPTREKAEAHERAVQYFKRAGYSSLYRERWLRWTLVRRIAGLKTGALSPGSPAPWLKA